MQKRCVAPFVGEFLRGLLAEPTLPPHGELRAAPRQLPPGRSQAAEPLVEFRDLTARVDDPLLAGPGRVRLRINIQPQRVPFLAHAGTGLELRAVGHHDGDLVVLGVDTGFHARFLAGPADPDRQCEPGRIAVRPAALKSRPVPPQRPVPRPFRRPLSGGPHHGPPGMERLLVPRPSGTYLHDADSSARPPG